jgi:hypothetical protein
LPVINALTNLHLSQARKKKPNAEGVHERYKGKSLLRHKDSIQRWLNSYRTLVYRETKAYPYPKVDLKNSEEFGQAYDNLNCHLKKIAAEGGDSTDSYPIIIIPDVMKLHEEAKTRHARVNDLDSKAFSEFKYFVTALAVPNRGHDGHHALTVGCFTEAVDIDGNSIIRFDPTKIRSKAHNGR